MTELILHHYPPSPVAEKIRAAMGVKQLAWRSVEENRLPDRPELLAMTGGYRRIPVLQVGADLYCDTQCILRELERRVPEPTLFPNDGVGMPFALSRWTDVALFDLTVRAALVSAADSMPPAVRDDRARLYFGADADLQAIADDMPHTMAQLRAQFGWIDDRLATGRPFLLGDQAGMPDLLVWYIVWFLRARYQGADELLGEFTALNQWADRIAAIGHGTPTEMTPAEALAVAGNTEPEPSTEQQTDPHDPQQLKPGDEVAVSGLTDSGEAPIQGTLHAVSRDTITLSREHPDCGRVAVHFPRVGYRVNVL